jgi:hypothetical protein
MSPKKSAFTLSDTTNKNDKSIMFSPLILPVAGAAAVASFIDDDAARWINSASKDIMDVQNEIEDFVGQVFPCYADNSKPAQY